MDEFRFKDYVGRVASLFAVVFVMQWLTPSDDGMYHEFARLGAGD
jgi:hypothetical protein